MEIDIDEILNRINIKKQELNNSIENSKNYNSIHNLSVELDNLIEEKFTAEKFNTEIKKYSKYLNLENRDELIKTIQKDTRINRPNTIEDEIQCFSRNVYIYACLVAYNEVSADEISKLLVLHNNIYHNRIKGINDPLVIKDYNTYSDLQYCVEIAKKYVALVLENIHK